MKKACHGPSCMRTQKFNVNLSTTIGSDAPHKAMPPVPKYHSISIDLSQITASAANACVSLLTSKSKTPRFCTLPFLCIVREAFPIWLAVIRAFELECV